jgi:hypothetical protein
LSDRLKNLLEKNEALQTIEERLDRQDYAGAIRHCDILVKMKSRWTMQALQIKAESLMHMGRYADAREVYAQVLAARSTLVWAQLGMAKAYKAESQFEQAKMMVQNIIDSKEGEKNIDAYDILAEFLEATGDMEGAMYVMKDSAAVIPSARRQRLVAEAAYLNGDLETAKECYARLAKATTGSVTSLPQDILAQAQTLVDTGDDSMTGGRIKRIHDYVKDDEAFCLTYGDGLSNVDIAKSVAFHKAHGKLATVTAVQTARSFGVLDLQGDKVDAFREKPVGDSSFINAGFFVLSPKVIDYIDGDDTSWEKQPLETLARDKQLMAYRHSGFWHCIDSLRDKTQAEQLWDSGKAPWKLW